MVCVGPVVAQRVAAASAQGEKAFRWALRAIDGSKDFEALAESGFEYRSLDIKRRRGRTSTPGGWETVPQEL